jgi:dTDP-4-dehydrorhamnose 3,5-epimerase
MDGVILNKLKIIEHPQGNIFHAMKRSDQTYYDFGEAYFSTIYKDSIKGWKKHSQMILNLIVPVGEIKFVIFDEKKKQFFSVQLSRNNYQRLTIMPHLWVAFQGISDINILLNIASEEHNPNESKNLELSGFDYKW